MKAAISVTGSVTNIEAFEDLKSELQDWDLKSVAESSEVSYSTIWYWMAGKTRKPRIDTIIKVAKVVGFTVKLVRVSRPSLKLVK